MRKNFLYSLLVATSVTTMMSFAHASDRPQDEDSHSLARTPISESEDQRPLFTLSEQRHLMANLESAREACTTAVAKQIGADNARIVVEEERNALSVVLVRNAEEIEGLYQTAERVRTDFQRQIQELNQTVATLAARALETENARREEVQARQLAESTILVVQQERDAQAQARQSADAILLEVRQERDAFAREIAQLRSEADLRRQLEQSESARDLEARERRAAEERLAQMEAVRLEAARVEAARLISIQIDENQARNLLSSHENVTSMTNEQRQRELQILNNTPTSRVNNLRIAQLQRLIQGSST